MLAIPGNSTFRTHSSTQVMVQSNTIIGVLAASILEEVNINTCKPIPQQSLSACYSRKLNPSHTFANSSDGSNTIIGVQAASILEKVTTPRHQHPHARRPLLRYHKQTNSLPLRNCTNLHTQACPGRPCVSVALIHATLIVIPRTRVVITTVH